MRTFLSKHEGQLFSTPDKSGTINLTLTEMDCIYIQRGTEMILRQGRLSLETDDTAYNVYTSTPVPLPASLLDKKSIQVGQYFIW
jgi:hypothetical protein